MEAKVWNNIGTCAEQWDWCLWHYYSRVGVDFRWLLARRRGWRWDDRMGSLYRKLDKTQSAVPSAFCAMVMQRNWRATSTRNNAAITVQSLYWLHRNLIESSFVFLSTGCFPKYLFPLSLKKKNIPQLFILRRLGFPE